MRNIPSKSLNSQYIRAIYRTHWPIWYLYRLYIATDMCIYYRIYTLWRYLIFCSLRTNPVTCHVTCRICIVQVYRVDRCHHLYSQVPLSGLFPASSHTSIDAVVDTGLNVYVNSMWTACVSRSMRIMRRVREQVQHRTYLLASVDRSVVTTQPTRVGLYRMVKQKAIDNVNEVYESGI